MPTCTLRSLVRVPARARFRGVSAGLEVAVID
jgi:hypothetical protein